MIEYNKYIKMTDSTKRVKVFKSKKEKFVLSRETLLSLSQEELIDKILKLEAHNIQLQSIIQKMNKNTNDVNLSKDRKRIDFSKVSKRHVFLKFYYLGWDYQGYVVQEDTNNTIEHFLFQALEKCCLIESRETSNYHRCGRTDKGVSAFSQVISIDLRSKLPEPCETNVDQEFPYCSMLNKILPDNIRCYAWCHVPPDASSRFHCSWRTYKYYFPKGNLNINAMQDATRYIVGTHDFRNLCKMDVGNGVTEFQREIESAVIKFCSDSQQDSGYQMYEFFIRGRGFLWHQIRCIMSVLFLVGQEKESPDVVKQLLDVDNNPAKPQYSMANHLPLNLYDVTYDEIPTKWIVNEDNLIKIIELLQSLWTSHAVKTSMIKNFISDLEKLKKSDVEIQTQAESLLSGIRSKVYKPLLTRMKCESLENKIEHYVKRKKLKVAEIKEEEEEH